MSSLLLMLYTLEKIIACCYPLLLLVLIFDFDFYIKECELTFLIVKFL